MTIIDATMCGLLRDMASAEKADAGAMGSSVGETLIDSFKRAEMIVAAQRRPGAA